MSGKRGDELVMSLPGERFTPFTLAKKLKARAILESASFKQGRARYSLILVDEAFRVVQEGDEVALYIAGERRLWDGCDGASGYAGMAGTAGIAGSADMADDKPGGRKPDILDALASVAAQNAGVAPGLPVPASGIGFLGYDFAARCDTLTLASKPDGIGVPESEFIVGHVYLIFDHYTDTIHAIGLNYAEHIVDLSARMQEIGRRLSDLDFSHLEPLSDRVPFTVVSDEAAEKAVFMAGVDSIREKIIAGDLLQAVLSRRLVAESSLGALEGYRRLRSASPSPYLFLVDFGSYALLGASPESLVRLRDGQASIRPIAGTRRRGKNHEEDQALEKELLADPKERAEHLMLLDLARNDLGRACEPGSVRVTRNTEAEQFSHVIHLVSEVEGELASNHTGLDLLRAAFPAGTVSGAPKLRAMEIVSGLEQYDRSFYAGAVGYLDASGGFDTCITIRSALVKDGRWYLQAGAGIVYGSSPEREWEETNEKLAALLAALGGKVATSVGSEPASVGVVPAAVDSASTKASVASAPEYRGEGAA
jgi:anthranilate synthase component 1